MNCSNAVTWAVRAKACRDIIRQCNSNSSTLREDVPPWICQRTALDLKLSNAQLAMKIEFYELNLETLWVLQSHVFATISSSVAFTANTIMLRHQPACQPPHSRAPSAMDVPEQPVPPIPPIPQPQARFLHGWKRHTTGEPITDWHWQLFWEFCFEETWRQQRLLHQWELLDTFHAHEEVQGREIRVGHANQVLQKRERLFYIVHLWTATLWQAFGCNRISILWPNLWSSIGMTKRENPTNGFRTGWPSDSLRQIHPIHI